MTPFSPLKPVKLTLTLPSSKSLMQRALICAALAQGRSTLHNPSYCQDTFDLMSALRQLGVSIRQTPTAAYVTGVNGKLRQPRQPINVGDSAANWRFLEPLVPAGTQLTGSAQLIRRIQAQAPTSQTVSGQLLAGKLTRPPRQLVSKGYVKMTQAVMKQFGVHGRFYTIEPDASAATYWQTYNWITDSKITFQHWPTTSFQPDYQYSRLLRKLTGRSSIFDLNGMPDSVMSLAVAAIFTNRKITITNIAHLAYKESNRLVALHENFKRIGIKTKIDQQSITIWGTGGNYKRVNIKTYHDHRIAMAFGILGLSVDDKACVKKSYPTFWQDYKRVHNASVVLTGMRAVGKTTVARTLAQHWQMRLIDIDEAIAQRARQPIAQVVHTKGWPYFRRIEAQLAQRYAKVKNTLIVTGGGTLMNAQSYRAMRHHYIILLVAPLTRLAQRLRAGHWRPPLTRAKTAAQEVRVVWAQRRKRYYAMADWIIKL